MSLTEQQTSLIKATVPVVQEHGNTITTVFYKNLLHDNPSLNNVFNHGNQLNGHQAKALAASLYGYASNIDNLEALLPAVEKIAQKHVSLYVNAAQYATVGKYLLAAMGEVLGDTLTPDILDAWSAAYTQLADLFISKEKSMQDEWPEWQDWREFKIAKKQRESDIITSFYLKPLDGKPLPKFKPGQYISIRTDVPALSFKQPRQYSLSDSWRPDYYRITVRRDEGLNVDDPRAPAHPGYVSNVLHDHKSEGDIVELSHPAGEFFLDIESDKKPFPVVLISAGVGLTPDLAMLKTILAAMDQRKVTWIHGTRNSKLSAFVPEISAIAKEHSNIRSIVFYSAPLSSDTQGKQFTHKGRIDLSKLQQSEDLMLNDMQTRYFICGPSKFMEEVGNYLVNGGVNSSRVKMEVFDTGMGPQAKSNKL